MKTQIYLYLLLILLLNSFDIKSQTITASNDTIINKWVNAIINIECQEANTELHSKISDLYYKKIITRKKCDYLNDSIDLISKKFGAAIFFTRNNNYYLLTARHVLHDDTSSDSNQICSRLILVETPTTLNQDTGIYIKHALIRSNLFEDTFIGDINDYIDFPLGYKDNPYVFSSVNDDLAIIHLKGRQCKWFLNTLNERNYKPINYNEFDTIGSSIFKEAPIMAIGFPIESELFSVKHPPVVEEFESKVVTVPFISLGTISKNNPNENFFEGNIFVYHGYSGGPVIDLNLGKFIGLTSQGWFEPKVITKLDPHKYFLLNHSIFIKSTLVPELLKTLEPKKSFDGQ